MSRSRNGRSLVNRSGGGQDELNSSDNFDLTLAQVEEELRNLHLSTARINRSLEELRKLSEQDKQKVDTQELNLTLAQLKQSLGESGERRSNIDRDLENLEDELESLKTKMMDLSLARDRHIPLPISPPIRAALQAFYAGGSKHQWTPDSYGRPQYSYQARDGHITLFFEHPPDTVETVGVLWKVVKDLSVETADIFLILMSQIAKLPNPQLNIARMSLEEIAEYRSVKLRHGSSQLLYDDFKQEVMRLADLRLTMGWQDYKGGTLFFGKERPDRLLDIVDVEYKRDGKSWTAFGFRCGQALAHFLDPDGLRWIGNYANLLLSLSPYHEALAKKIGTYWTLVGTIAGKGGMQPHATIRSILEFCGEEPNMEKPGRTVEAIIEAHERLREIGVLEEIPDFEPPTRLRGFFQDWLDETRTVKLAESLWKLNQPSDRTRLLPSSPQSPVRRNEPGSRNLRVLPSPPSSQTIVSAPAELSELYETPARIQQFRAEYHLHQAELAQALGISRETLSRYERGVRKLPEEIAKKILELWETKASGWQD